MKAVKSRGRWVKRAIVALLIVALLVGMGLFGACSSNQGAIPPASSGALPESAGGAENTQSPYQPKQSSDMDYGFEAVYPSDAAPVVVEDTPTMMAMPEEPTASKAKSSKSKGSSKKSTPTAAEQVDTQATSASTTSNTSASTSTSTSTSPVDSIINVQAGRKITFWADFTINTKNFDADYRAIYDMINHSGGFIASENLRDPSTYTSYGAPVVTQGRFTTMRVQVPAVGYTAFLDGMSVVGDIESMNKHSDDLTATYFDTQARIEMLELRRDRLLKYLEDTESAENIVTYERELSSVLYELDNYQSNKRQLDQLVEYSTIDITLIELITPETIDKNGEPLGDRAGNAFSQTSANVSEFFQNVVVWFAGAAPVLIILIGMGLVAWLIIVIVKKARRSSKKSSAAQPQPTPTVKVDNDKSEQLEDEV